MHIDPLTSRIEQTNRPSIQTGQPATSIRSLIGKRAVITPNRVELVTPIESGAAAVESMFNLMRLTYPERPVAMVFDGWIRKEYGRPLDPWEVDEALANSGLV